MKICMLLKRNFEEFKKDSRVLKEAMALKESGYDVAVIIYDSIYRCFKYQGIDVYCAGILNIRFFKNYNNYSSEGRGRKRNLVQKILNRFMRFFYDAKYNRVTFETACSIEALIYHCHDFETLHIGCNIKRHKNIRLIYDSHELWTESIHFLSIIDKVFKKQLYSIRERKLIREADACITVCESISNYLCKKYKTNKPYVIKNIPEYHALDKKQDYFKNELGLDEGTKIVLYQGGITKGRGLSNLVKAFEYVDNNIVLVIMGYGSLKEKLKSEISCCIYKERIFLKDAVDPDVLLYYTSSSDVGVSPIEDICLSYYYASPNKMWEYIHAGIPVLASDFPEMGKFILKEGLGMGINPHSPHDIADKINYILDEKNKNQYMGIVKNCIEKSKSTYNWGMEKRKLLSIYKVVESNIL